MHSVAIIPARRGSVRIPGKNWKDFHGKPIIQYSIEAAQRSRLFDSIIVSTDGDEIERVAKAAGAWVVRRPVDDGTRGTQEVAAEVLRHWSDYGFVMRMAHLACVIYPTCPMLHECDLFRGWQLLHSHGVVYSRAGDSWGSDIGWYYWGSTGAFLNAPHLLQYGKDVAVQVIGEDRAIDINTPQDWDRASEMAAKLWGENGKD